MEKTLTLERLPYFWQEPQFSDYVEMKRFNDNGLGITWSTWPDKSLGLPGPFDFDVWQEIHEQRDKQLSPEDIYIDSARSFLQEIGRPPNSKWLKYLHRSFKRLLCTSGHYRFPKGSGFNLQALCQLTTDIELDSKGQEADSRLWLKLGNNDCAKQFGLKCELVRATPDELSTWSMKSGTGRTPSSKLSRVR